MSTEERVGKGLDAAARERDLRESLRPRKVDPTSRPLSGSKNTRSQPANRVEHSEKYLRRSLSRSVRTADQKDAGPSRADTSILAVRRSCSTSMTCFSQSK